MHNIRISSNGRALRSGEELFNLENVVVGYEDTSKKAIRKSCDVEGDVAVIETYEQFYTGHDDSEIVVIIRDRNGNVLWEWAFDHVMGSGAEIEAEKLISYLEEKYGCPVSRASWSC